MKKLFSSLRVTYYRLLLVENLSLVRVIDSRYLCFSLQRQHSEVNFSHLLPLRYSIDTHLRKISVVTKDLILFFLTTQLYDLGYICCFQGPTLKAKAEDIFLSKTDVCFPLHPKRL